MNQGDTSKSLTVLAVALTIVMFVATWKLILPSYSSNQAKISTLDQEINQANERKDQLDAARSSLASLNSAYNAITVAVSDDADEANIISELESIALKNGLVLPSISINPSTTVSNETDSSTGTTGAALIAGQAIDISLGVSGSLDQLNNFITALEKSVKFMNITSMSFAKGNDGDNIDLSLAINAFSRVAATAENQVAGEGANE